MNLNNDMIKAIAGKIPTPKNGMGVKQAIRYRGNLTEHNISTGGTYNVASDYVAGFFAMHYLAIFIDEAAISSANASVDLNKEVIAKSRAMNKELVYYATVDCTGLSAFGFGTTLQAIKSAEVNGVFLENFSLMDRADQSLLIQNIRDLGMRAAFEQRSTGSSIFDVVDTILLSFHYSDIVVFKGMFWTDNESIGVVVPAVDAVYNRWNIINTPRVSLGNKTPGEAYGLRFMALDELTITNSDIANYITNAYIGCMFFGIDMYCKDFALTENASTLQSAQYPQPYIEDIVAPSKFVKRDIDDSTRVHEFVVLVSDIIPSYTGGSENEAYETFKFAWAPTQKGFVNFNDGNALLVWSGTDQFSILGAEARSQAQAIAVNSAKVGITTGQASAITANSAKVGITTAQASAITANSAKVGITTAQANAITANTSKVTYPSTAATKLAGIATGATKNVITSGTATPSGGNDGDIYLQYE